MHIPLEEIKRKLEIKKSQQLQEGEVEEHIYVVAQHMKQLYNELNLLLPIIDQLNEQQKQNYFSKLTTEGSALMHSLHMLTS